MTPLIDIMLVLLIIFIITIPVMTHAVKIDNPLPPPPNFVPPPPPEVVNLSIDFDGTLLWNATPVDRKTMQGYIAQEAAKTPQPEVHITVDKFAQIRKSGANTGGFAEQRPQEDRIRQQRLVLGPYLR